ncbi:MAG: mandelate racemase/muconate lactonizing enzyme family protein [bacterium]|nr:mandelate racemase/muconate lactonizing enzyme family protein [bacterium]
MNAEFQILGETEQGRQKIRDIKTMMLQGSRSYTLVKVIAEDGLYGIGEAYGSPGVGVKEQIEAIKPSLIGRDPLEIDVLYTLMGQNRNPGTGWAGSSRTDGSAHALMRAASGIEMALWDLAGKILGVSSTVLLGGKFRDKVRVYDHARPRDLLDRASCEAWAQKVKEDPAGFTCHKFGFSHTTPETDAGRDLANRVLTVRELRQIEEGFANCREALGWDHDIMVHCHWEYDVRTAIQIAEAVAPIKPVWLEDPMIVNNSESWKRLTASSPVPICTGENLWRRQEFADFVVHQGCDILHPDLRNSGGFMENKRIADMAEVWGVPMATHNTGSQLNTWATCQWAGSIRDFIACETVTGKGDWMDDLLILDGPYIENGYLRITDKPGLGVDLNPDVAQAHLAKGETWWG